MANEANRNESTAYEETSRAVAEHVRGVVDELIDADIRHGSKNRWAGASGYSHQIDVSIETSDLLSLVDCKRWGRPVGTLAVLALAGRVRDVQDTYPNRKVEGIIASRQRCTKGAVKLAAYCGIILWTISDAAGDAAFADFAIKYRNRVMVGPPSIKSTTTIGDAKVVIVNGPDTTPG